MSQLQFNSVPAIYDTPDASFNTGQPLDFALVQQISDTARAAAVRTEVLYMGWFKNGDVVPQPISPVDGYVYSRAETRYLCAAFFSQPPNIFTSGQKTRPYANPSQGLKIDYMKYDVDDSTGQVLTNVYYESANPGFPGGGASGLTGDGMVKVVAICTRQSVNSDGGTN